MKKILICVFAHPDDEAFGPSGTLLKLRSEGYDIHLILLTDGEAGTNSDNIPDLGAMRLKEWHTAAALIPANSTHALHYADGALDSTDHNQLFERTHRIVSEIVDTYTETTALSFITFESNGLTGHRDHIVASNLATKLAKNFSAQDIWYFCLDKTQAPLDNTAYYEPRAREDSYITARINVSTWLERKLSMMDAHASQRLDAATMKKLDLSTECFHIDTL